MFPTDAPTAVSALPTPVGAGTPGFFTGGNPASGTPATVVDPDWLNMVQQELINVAEAAGLTPSKTTYNQVLLAIKRMVQAQTVLADSGTANAYAVANALPPLTTTTWTNGVVQQFVVAHTNTGPSTFAPDALTPIPICGLGLQPLQGNEMFAGGTAILMKQMVAGINSGNPIAILLECSGGAQQIAPATQSNQAVNLGQFGSSLSNSGYQKLPSGLIIQWGLTGGANPNVLTTITYPLAFPNGTFSVALQYVDGTLNTGAARGNPTQVGVVSKTAFNFYQSGTTNACQYYWFAIGY